MTVLDHSPRSTWAPRLQRRHEIVTTGGMQGVLDIGTALRACGFPVREFAVEVRDGVPYSSVTTFADRLGAVPAVLSVEPC